MSADLTCPGCGGALPDCPCRSGLTAGTFSNSAAGSPPSLAAILGVRDTIRALPPAPPFDKVAKSERLTGTDHWLDERHRVLFVSPEAFAEILKNFPEASHGG